VGVCVCVGGGGGGGQKKGDLCDILLNSFEEDFDYSQ
jgi:hypothetical protein